MGHDSLVGHDGGEVVVGWYLVGYLSPSLVGSWLGPVNLFFHNINQKTLTGAWSVVRGTCFNLNLLHGEDPA